MKYLALLLVLAGLSACSTPAQRLANDRCHGHWQVVTTQVNGKPVYKAECAKP